MNDPKGQPPDQVGTSLANHATAVARVRRAQADLERAQAQLNAATQDLRRHGWSMEKARA